MRIDIDISLELQGPFMTKSSAPGEYGIDSVLARNADGEPYLPGTLIAGKLRQAWEELRDAVSNNATDMVPNTEQIDNLLGKQLSGGQYEPKAKRLFFTDFIFRGDVPSSKQRYRIEIDKTRGAVDEGKLMIAESPFTSGSSLFFDGRLSFITDGKTETETERDRVRRQVLCGMQWVSQAGAFRTIGFGRIIGVQMGDPVAKEVDIDAEKGNWSGTTGFDLVLHPDAPFCIAGHPKADNIFESREEISGAVIKGCLARALNQLQGQTSHPIVTEITDETDAFYHIRKHFSAIRVTHAFPGASCFTRPVRQPLSLVKADGLFDVALLDKPALINDRAPEFSIDWKDETDVKNHFGWPRLDRELRVRTAIDREKLRHQDEQLFAYEMIVPGGCCWHARVDVSDIAEGEREQVLEQLAAVFKLGLLGFGKSKVTAGVRVLPKKTVANACDTGRIGHWLGYDGLLVLTLQTPALLLDPQPLAKRSDAATLFEEYKKAWDSLSSTLVLKRFFARQQLSGGRYQQSRFQGNTVYQPWLLTVEGSVFVFAAKDREAASGALQAWLAGGLPLPAPVLEAYNLPDNEKSQWQSCPFVRQNGFGEIAVNLKIHETFCPPAAKCETIKNLGGAS